LQCSPWGLPAGAEEQNSGEARRGSAEEGLRRGPGTLGARFDGLDRGGAAPASGHAGGQGRWPSRLPFSGEGGSVGLESGVASYW
jgi:hypothetical protein